ncbi:hypothetical protein [Weissella ceti]|uniref:Uncharacterized protein n=1 Tax=Weissella ceti TaxID=759620 RepID=A0A088GHF9_9LACO|nr:hypothetical protein [Weissella ceti]AIM63100.1 hypothetical protein WS74_0848 [Weissella ceti]
MNAEQDYINKTFFKAEDVPKLVGPDIDGTPMYTGDEVYVAGDKYLLTANANPQTKKLAKSAGLKVKVL